MRNGRSIRRSGPVQLFGWEGRSIGPDSMTDMRKDWQDVVLY
jgi:hypothetical protein